jgi:hypothetical protein
VTGAAAGTAVAGPGAAVSAGAAVAGAAGALVFAGAAVGVAAGAQAANILNMHRIANALNSICFFMISSEIVLKVIFVGTGLQLEDSGMHQFIGRYPSNRF